MLGALIVGALALTVLYRRQGPRNVLFVAGAFFYLFAFGPVLSIFFGLGHYSGIVLSRVDAAAWGFAYVLLTLAVVDLAYPQKPRTETSLVAETRPTPLLPLAYLAFTLYAVGHVILSGLTLLGSDKLSQVDAAGAVHPYILLLGMVLVCSRFLTPDDSLVRGLWLGTTVSYVLYNLVTSERDFLLTLASLLVHRLVVERGFLARFSGLAVGVLAAGAALLATAMFTLRSGSGGVTAADVLNQGSILFIDSVIRDWVPGGIPFAQGSTYVGAVLSLVPDALLPSDHVPLPTWFLDSYAPGSRFGYGFSLSAEAYMNFGELGIPLVFGALAAFHRWLVNRAPESPAWCTFSAYALTILMYAFRGDFNQYLKALLFGLAVLLVVTLAAGRSTGQSAEDRRARRRAARRRRLALDGAAPLD